MAAKPAKAVGKALTKGDDKFPMEMCLFGSHCR